MQEISEQMNDRIKEIIKILKDENFTNIKKRIKFAMLITELIVSSNAPEIRKIIKRLGDVLTDLGDSISTDEPEEEINEIKEEIVYSSATRIETNDEYAFSSQYSGKWEGMEDAENWRGFKNIVEKELE